ncbi:MAG: hypothetical protein QXI32_00690 [Candidatus Bathyarchaeia archaeon]
MIDLATAEFIQRLRHFTSRWGLDQCACSIWAILLATGEPMTQEDLREASGYGPALVSGALSRLDELGFVATCGRKNRKKLYVAVFSFMDALESFFKRLIDNEVTPMISNLSRRLHEISDSKRKANMERLVGEFEKGRLFITYLLSTMKKHRDLPLGELQQALNISAV